MPLLSRSLKNTGKLFRVNELVRSNPKIKQALNQDPVIRAQVAYINTQIKAIATSFGTGPAAFDFIESKLTDTPFPMVAQIWMGKLSFDTRGGEDGGGDSYDHAEGVAEAGQKIRERTAKVIALMREMADVYQSTIKANPGGPVGQ